MMDPSQSTSPLGDILASIDVSPETFLQPSASLQAASLVAAKRILDPVVPEYSVFREVALKGLDVEQVWEQVRLVGDEVKRILEREGGLGARLKTTTSNGTGSHSDEEDNSSGTESDYEEEYLEEEEEGDDDDLEDDDEDEDMVDDEDLSGSDEENLAADEFPTNPELDEDSDGELNSTKATQPKQFKKDVHGLNDEFFSIDDFNRLTEQQDISKSDDENEDEIDYFGGISHDFPG
jgi:U3 small nucleolar RNA-associated protein MPP10